jgi:hypothetical protein
VRNHPGGSTAEDALRMAVGQLLDYGRIVDSKRYAVLVPTRPRDDLLAFLAAAGGVTAIYPDGARWTRAEPYERDGSHSVPHRPGLSETPIQLPDQGNQPCQTLRKQRLQT